MTLLDDICQVHDGVLKAPPLPGYGDATTISKADDYAYDAGKTNPNHEHVYNDAKTLAVEAVRIMQLATKNIEKSKSSEKFKNELVEHFNQRVVKPKIEVLRIELSQDEPDYVFEVGILLGTVKKT